LPRDTQVIGRRAVPTATQRSYLGAHSRPPTSGYSPNPRFNEATPELLQTPPFVTVSKRHKPQNFMSSVTPNSAGRPA
jgi:hypothetical protein